MFFTEILFITKLNSVFFQMVSFLLLLESYYYFTFFLFPDNFTKRQSTLYIQGFSTDVVTCFHGKINLSCISWHRYLKYIPFNILSVFQNVNRCPLILFVLLKLKNGNKKLISLLAMVTYWWQQRPCWISTCLDSTSHAAGFGTCR